MFLLHLLMMATTLLGLPASDEDLHGLEDLVHPAHMSVDEVFVVYFQKPMVESILSRAPVTVLYFFIACFAKFLFSFYSSVAFGLILQRGLTS